MCPSSKLMNHLSDNNTVAGNVSMPLHNNIKEYVICLALKFVMNGQQIV